VESIDITKLSKRQLVKHFEQERQEYLKEGMSEAHIYYIHFGSLNENGRGGDYREWLNEQKHIRSNHKYCPGSPLVIHELDNEGIWIVDTRDDIVETEIQIDLDNALSSLTELQRFCFVEVILNGRTQQSVANDLGVSRENVKQAIFGAIKKMKNFYSFY